MSGQVWKSATVFEGPGFGDQGDVVRSLELAGLKVRRVSPGAGTARFSTADQADILGSDFLILRSPWSATPEDILYAQVLAERLRRLLPLEDGPSLLGIGRGALVLLSILLGDLSSLEWSSAFEDSPKWVDLRSSTGSGNLTLKGFVQGRAVARVKHDRLLPWLTHEALGPVGWRIDKRVWISLVDILAYDERVQLPEFGYADLTQVPTQTQLIERFARGQW